MKFMLVLIFTLLSFTVATQNAFAESVQNTSEEPVRHIVVFKYTPGATDSQIRQVTEAFRELKDKIPGITHFEYGINNSPEGKDQDFTHIYQMTFEDEEARDIYLPHPEHKKFGELLGRLDILEDVFVVDYVPVAE